MFERYIRDSLGDWTLYTLHCVQLALNYELSREQVRTALLIQANVSLKSCGKTSGCLTKA